MYEEVKMVLDKVIEQVKSRRLHRLCIRERRRMGNALR